MQQFPMMVLVARVATIAFCLQMLVQCAQLDETRTMLNEECKRRLDFKTIKLFDTFAKALKQYEATSTPNSDKGFEHLAKCLSDKEAIYALQALVASYEKERPCKYSEVTKLEEFARKFLLINPMSRATKFFTLFGVSIGISCRINLLAHLKQADSEVEQIDFIYGLASPTGWDALINEYTKKSMKFGTSGQRDSHVINRISKLVPGLSQIDQLNYLSFDHVMDDDESKPTTGIETISYQLKNSVLKSKVLISIYKIVNSCKNLDKFYVNSVLSMAKLKSLGLMVDFLNDLHDGSALLHKWLVATSFCQLMARVRIITSKTESSEEPNIDLEIIHKDTLLEHRMQLYSYAAPFEEIHERAVELVWQATVYEGNWRHKSEAMWQHTDEQKPTSVAMKLLVQFMKGLENDFQQELNSSE